MLPGMNAATSVVATSQMSDFGCMTEHSNEGCDTRLPVRCRPRIVSSRTILEIFRSRKFAQKSGGILPLLSWRCRFLDRCQQACDFLDAVDSDGCQLPVSGLPGHCQMFRHLHQPAFFVPTLCHDRRGITEPHLLFRIVLEDCK